MPRGCYIHPTLIRALETGSTIWLTSLGQRPQTDKDGNQMYGADGAPYMELHGRITFAKPTNQLTIAPPVEAKALPSEEPEAVEVEVEVSISDEQGNLIPF
jgi:hypothetical protein